MALAYMGHLLQPIAGILKFPVAGPVPYTLE